MNVAFIGGSITEGTGANGYENSYVYKLYEYFKCLYNEVNIKNMGISGTSSKFAMFRLKRDLENFKPDLMFVEFSVNDRIYKSYDITLYFEGLIRECVKYTDKIIILCMPTGLSDACSTIHKKIAYFYNIPCIDIQDEVSKMIGRKEITWTKISIDNLHPNNRGHNLYYEIIKRYLNTINIDEIKAEYDNRTLSKYRFINPVVENYNSKNIIYYGEWIEKDINLPKKIDKAAVSLTPGNGLRFKFIGKNIHMINLCGNKSGIIECNIDGYGFYIDLYSEKDDFKTTINLNNLIGIEHELIIKISDKQNDKSRVHEIIVVGFLIEAGV